jgi:hypothetical protein
LRRTRHFEIGDGCAAFVDLLVDVPVPPDFEIETLGERVDDGDTDPVQTTRDLVAVVIELASGMKHGQHDLGGRLAALVAINGDATAVVDDCD